jgi:hypothetical protein
MSVSVIEIEQHMSSSLNDLAKKAIADHKVRR